MAFGIGNQQFQRMGEFGAYISVVFIVLFLFFYSILGTLNINFMHVFDHYFILLPTVGILGLIGIPLKVVATETVCLQGVEEMTIIIGGPCSGLYSMFLLMGLIFGYSRVEKIEFKKTLLILGFSMLVAYLSNLFRVIILYLTAYTYGKETMMLVHTHLGWIIFAIIAAFIMYFVEIKNK
jgi:archaeosortase C (PEF-CTERM variant)